MIHCTLHTQENKHITTITIRKRLGKMASVVKLHRKTDKEDGKREGGGISQNKCSTMPCELRCYLINTFSSSCNHNLC
jgi:hypothetical protein